MSGTQLQWQLRRGMKELDVLLERYHRRRFPAASAAERKALARLLECEDPEIWQWIFGQAPVPAEFEHVIGQLRRHD